MQKCYIDEVSNLTLQHGDLSAVPDWLAFSSPAAPCALFSPEWGTGEEPLINVLLIQSSKLKHLCRLHCQLGVSCLEASGFAVYERHETKARLFHLIKTVTVLAQMKKGLPFLCTCSASGSSCLKISGIWVHPQSMMQCHEILALVSLEEAQQLIRSRSFFWIPLTYRVSTSFAQTLQCSAMEVHFLKAAQMQCSLENMAVALAPQEKAPSHEKKLLLLSLKEITISQSCH